jgi:hypothetical protein
LGTVMEDRNMPATKADLEGLEVRLNGRAEALEGRLNERIEILRSEMQYSLQDMTEAMRDGQTEVLKAFYSFAQSNNKRMMELEGNEARDS